MKRWYVIQVYAGYEQAVKDDLERRLDKEGMRGYFGQILVPSAQLPGVSETLEAKKDQQLFPGYLLVEMDIMPETMRFVLSTPRVVRFLGGKEPAALAQKEIDRIVSQIKGEVVVFTKKSDYEAGQEVEITDGPFAGFVGIIDAIDEENERLTVSVSIFGRMTPVELKFDQVKR
jgi:transcriptional antiterminator NusG